MESGRPRRGADRRKEKKAGIGSGPAKGGMEHEGPELVPGGEAHDDDLAWEEYKKDGDGRWGGRGRGGRAVARQHAGMSDRVRDVHLPSVSLAVGGKELLVESSLRLVQGRRYALLGQNGVGKSTLLHRIAVGKIPGFPQHLRVALVAQEESRAPPQGKSAVDWLLAMATSSATVALEREKETLMEALEQLDLERDPEAFDHAQEWSERLGEIEMEEDALRGPEMQQEAASLLQDMGMSRALMTQPAASLSGGQRMRLKLAHALLAKADILLLDEPTNHLDLHAVLWLEAFLTRGGVGKAGEVATPKCPGTIVLVSHDRCFVENVATDVIVFEDTKLVQYPCGLRDYEETVAQSARRLEALRDGSARQERHALDAAAHMRRQAARCKGGVNDSILKQAKQKVDKIERIGLYREDGKAFKTHSLATLDEHAVRLPTKIQAAHAAREVIFDFPSPNTLARCTKFDTIITVDNVSVGYSPSPPYLISEASVQITPRTRAALAGNNGSGKTTLLLLLLGRLAPVRGHLVTLPGVEIGYVPQHHAEALPLDLTPAAYLSELFGVCEFETRKRLGKFGITGRSALLQMGSLSGGQRVRVSLTKITWTSPDVLLLDEPTNHLDEASISALADGLLKFDGAVVVVSHNRDFLARCCQDLWLVEDGNLLTFRANEDTDFKALFQDYTTTVASGITVARAMTAESGSGGALRSSSQANTSIVACGEHAFERLLPSAR